eukprot:gene14511-17154_t
MHVVMHEVLLELRSEHVAEEVQELAANASRGGHSKAEIAAQFRVLKTDATIRALRTHGFDEVEGFIRVM